MKTIDLHYFLHGLIILMIGLVGGFPFAKAIKSKNGREVAWRVVHSGSSMAGVMLIAIGGMINRLSFSIFENIFILIGLIVATYLFVIGMVVAAWTGERGIGSSKENYSSTWKIVYYLYGIAAVMTIVSFIVLIVVCVREIIVKS